MDQTNTPSPRYATLRDYLRVIREQRWIILAITLVAGGIAFAVSIRQDDVYETSAALSFQDKSQQLSLLGGSVSPRTPPEETPQARAATIESPAVIKRVQRALDTEVPVGELASAISTLVDPKSFLVDVTARWGDAEFAARLANEFGEQAARYTNKRTRAEFTAAVKNVEDELDNLGSAPEDAAEHAALAGQRARLKFLISNARSAQVVRSAAVPGSPVSPKPVRNTALGLLLGLVVGILIAFLRDSLDRRLRGQQEIQAETGLPLLGHVRNEALGGVIGLSEDLDAFRILRQNLDFLAVDLPVRRSILVTSALPEEGKSTVAASLACTTAMLGRKTLLLECDLRRPALAGRLNIDTQPGLTDCLVGDTSLEEATQGVKIIVEPPADSNGSRPTGSQAESTTLACVTAGSPSPQQAELLQSKRFEEFLQEATSAYETVIIDTAPLLPVADTLELIPRVDCVLLCVRSRQTTRDQAGAAKAALDHFPPRPMGLVVTGLDRQDTAEYGYYSYSHGYAPAAREKPASEAGSRDR